MPAAVRRRNPARLQPPALRMLQAQSVSVELDRSAEELGPNLEALEALVNDAGAPTRVQLGAENLMRKTAMSDVTSLISTS
eukprot:SAG11_NODE_8496_length_1009_cov_0.867033_2_plen_81_part_00